MRSGDELPPDMSGLLGDRSALAAFVMAHEGTIRGIARRKLTRRTRAVFDSDDVLATVLRRIDGLAERHGIRATSEGEIVSLILTIAENAANSKSRLIELARARLVEDREFSLLLVERLNACADNEDASEFILRMYASLSDSDARVLFLLRMRGIEHRVVAQMLGISAEACRQRWKKIRDDLVARFARA